MIWCSILISLASGFHTKDFVFPSKGEQEFGIFQQWTKEHRRIYQNSEESETRYQIFQRNLKYITEMNAKKSKSPSSYRLGLNKFADMSPEEFKEIYLHELKIPTTIASGTNTTAKMDYGQQKDSCGARASMDWRQSGVVTGVKNQQQSCGGCWAFAAAAAIESVHAIATRELISLSEQQLIDCDSKSQGCSGGWISNAFDWVINNGGISKEEDYPYEAQQGYCRASMNGNSVVKINSYERVAQSDDALLCAIAKQPIAVALDATNIQLYNGGIYEGEDCPKESTSLNHAVLIVGYGSTDGKDYWTAKNSWGESWGMNGYILIQRNSNFPNGVCSINTAAYYPTI
ncbi:hypothetical protein K1719_031903 [Acacia pycnantha]|nr:hypothetical protein K1719_046837 [Acacia pycnantha]KAI9086153.1 hypothetical protein K1719_031874 [Acacia pycnantha]KAI9086182.1 hypothetical protein K1719_031903 [Acacia pycnantha]